jgi:microcystin degradation protein MlrC
MPRILAAGLGHETNTFAVTPTTPADFQRDSLLEADGRFALGEGIAARRRGTRTILGGYLDGAARAGLELVPLLAAWATPGGVVEQPAYEQLKALLLERLAAAGEYDGVLLDLHGAMVTEALDDAEGDLIAAVRAAAGQRPVIATLDLHANVTERMARHADAIIGFDEYPHVDMYDRGLEAAALMAATVRGGVRPALAWEQLPLITMPPRQCTLLEPMRSLLSRARAVEREPGVLNVTLALGFPFADIRDAGVSVLVTTDADPDLARRQAAAMAAAIWERRDEFDVTLTPVPEAIAAARALPEGLVVLADGSDNPGGGAPCDGTEVLRQFLEAGVEAAVVAVIADPAAVAQAVAAGVRNEVTLDLGGKTDDRHGPPVRLTARVRLLSDGEWTQRGPMGEGVRVRMGRTAVLVAGGVEIVVTERRVQPYDVQLLRSLGIEPTQRRLVALKSIVHFRSTYQDLAARIFEVDTPGIHRPDFASVTYQRLRRPIYPLDPVRG